VRTVDLSALDFERPSLRAEVLRHAADGVGVADFAAPMEFEGPTLVVEGTGVTHLRYRVRR
jgi:hypothetical protein